ncbi:hypothetical protein [Streptomyces sp. NPDC056169]|uniref:hypothetical protein n=1 Tax=Streptomyces sp. NPDC056169 TaxID=3345734 RepID=UPI0035D5DC52
MISPPQPAPIGNLFDEQSSDDRSRCAVRMLPIKPVPAGTRTPAGGVRARAAPPPAALRG